MGPKPVPPKPVPTKTVPAEPAEAQTPRRTRTRSATGSDAAPDQPPRPTKATSRPRKAAPRASAVQPERPAPPEPDPVIEELEADDLGADVRVAETAAGSSGHSGGSGWQTGAVPPPLDLAAVLNEVGEVLRKVLGGLSDVPVDRIRSFAADPLKGLFALAQNLGVDWQTTLEDAVGFARSRMTGEYAVDEFGFDPEFTEKIFLPAIRPLVRNWFRVEVRGVENIPLTGSALLVSNHAGTLPLDGLVLHAVVYDEILRHVRMLGADLVFKTPYSHDFARRIGTTLACAEDAERLLHSDQLVSVYPEGFKGLGKPFADRYKLQRFGRGGFVSAAVRAQVPIVPVAVVGSEEIYPLLSGAPTIARAMGVPYFPVTPLFPWFGVLGMIPLPSKWIISFGEAIATDELPAGAADDPMIVFNVTDQVRETIQHSLYELLMQRRSAFF
jgi:1-acyl-sn-glycerol-3-phosphate acyltransferase